MTTIDCMTATADELRSVELTPMRDGLYVPALDYDRLVSALVGGNALACDRVI